MFIQSLLTLLRYTRLLSKVHRPLFVSLTRYLITKCNSTSHFRVLICVNGKHKNLNKLPWLKLSIHLSRKQIVQQNKALSLHLEHSFYISSPIPTLVLYVSSLSHRSLRRHPASLGIHSTHYYTCSGTADTSEQAISFLSIGTSFSVSMFRDLTVTRS